MPDPQSPKERLGIKEKSPSTGEKLSIRTLMDSQKIYQSRTAGEWEWVPLCFPLNLTGIL